MKRFTHWFFGIGSETHRQVYYSWREYPLAMFHTALAAFMFGAAVVATIGLAFVR
ncbi:hypothetical protein [Sphingobium xenophagum]|uniref:hypothetical protein n=1 Tax=Sphingobium xenophagum TaxID=121428 RepID=UPI0002EA9BC7|nr:hypothetical protein [Sphingobium xenophagum]